MIEYTTIDKFEFNKKNELSSWVQFVLDEEEMELGEVNYIFCNDDYLHEINVKSLKHNTLTDIISFDYSLGTVVSGDIYISHERVRDNANHLNTDFIDELHRVMVHGILHYCGYKDESDAEKQMMRSKEDYYLSLRTF